MFGSILGPLFNHLSALVMVLNVFINLLLYTDIRVLIFFVRLLLTVVQQQSETHNTPNWCWYAELKYDRTDLFFWTCRREDYGLITWTFQSMFLIMIMDVCGFIWLGGGGCWRIWGSSNANCLCFALREHPYMCCDLHSFILICSFIYL